MRTRSLGVVAAAAIGRQGARPRVEPHHPIHPGPAAALDHRASLGAGQLSLLLACAAVLVTLAVIAGVLLLCSALMGTIVASTDAPQLELLRLAGASPG